MINTFDSVRSLIKINKICIDNIIFRLHYKVTVILLLGFSIVVTARQYVGDPIDCLTDGRSSIPQKIMDSYCWIYSTYTLPESIGTIGEYIVREGVGSIDGVQKYHHYYQWVCFMLFFQAILFYIPRYLWKNWEGERIKKIALHLGTSVIENNEKITKQCTLITEYLIKHVGLQNCYVYRLFLCEILNLINVIGQMFLLDLFFDGQFTTYGIEVIKHLQMEPEKRIDPMSRIFPRLTKCLFYKFGSSGAVQKFDSMCLLSLNVVNEKIYIFIWFWFIILAILSMLNIIYRTAIICGPNKLRAILLNSRSRISKRSDIEVIMKVFNIDDWFILYQLAKNIDIVICKQLIIELAASIENISSEQQNCKLNSIKIQK